jgi:transcriptional regulator with XRE-family HTH domain
MDIGSRLKEERERLGLTQKALGAIGDFGKTTVIAWERGTAFPNALFLADIAAIGADIRYIVTGDRDAPPPEVLTADERCLLDRYRSSPAPLKDAALRVLLGAEPGKTTHFEGSQQVFRRAPKGDIAGRDIVKKERK